MHSEELRQCLVPASFSFLPPPLPAPGNRRFPVAGITTVLWIGEEAATHSMSPSVAQSRPPKSTPWWHLQADGPKVPSWAELCEHGSKSWFHIADGRVAQALTTARSKLTQVCLVRFAHFLHQAYDVCVSRTLTHSLITAELDTS